MDDEERRAKRAEYARRWRAKNPERSRQLINDAMARWRAKNPEKFRQVERERKQRYRLANPERVKASNAKWRAKDPERARQLANEKSRRWRERNHDKVIASRRARYQRSTSKKAHLSVEETATIHSLFAEGLSFKEIAQRTGRMGGTVARCLRQTQHIRRRPVKRGPGSNGWKGVTRSHGYVYVWVSPDDEMASMRSKQGRIAEHRLVLARVLGRPLFDHETGHHINGDRDDNRPENLQLRHGKHGKGIAFACLDCGSHRIGPAPLGARA